VTGYAPRIRDAGDSALLLELDAVVDADVNARAIAIAGAVERAGIPGVRAVVPTYRSVAVFFDPLDTDVSLVAHALRTGPQAGTPQPTARVIEVPVAYGGVDGPDIEEVAARARISVQDVIERHVAGDYRVFMLGFLPGFAYMGPVDETIAAPRRAMPRLKVAAGSVGIAGRQTGIYPRESPGGWQLIGRTPVEIFDPARTPASLFAPGDRVRFVPAKDRRLHLTQVNAQVSRPAPAVVAGGRYISVETPGLLTTIQDAGRWAHQAVGVPVAGPMDVLSHRLANLIVGNTGSAAALEATVTGPDLRIETDAVMAITGADLSATLHGASIPINTAVHCGPGAVIRFGDRRAGARAYVAFDGGIGTEPMLGSRSTHVMSGLGGFGGRALKAGDHIALQQPSAPPIKKRGVGPVPTGGARLRVLAGPQDDFFPPAAVETLQRTRFTITSQSDRMGYRLAGRARIERTPDREMISDATFVGAIQVPPSGDPILLMADRATTGGYPQIATVISADLPLAGQLAPGDWIEFQLCTRAEAIAALVTQEARLFGA
jgi:KipI family sensor histidine kinase inhibitor